MARLPIRSATLAGDVRGGVRLVIDGVQGVTGIVEAMHHRIARVSAPLGTVRDEPTRGITGLVYRGIRGTTGLVGQGLDAALAGVQALLTASWRDLPEAEAAPRRDAVVSALNGVVGDHLERTGNPLAIAMTLRTREAAPGPRLLLLIHGLCMNDRQWMRDGHDHGMALSKALGLTPVYARYNTGRHISVNGRELANRLEDCWRTGLFPSKASLSLATAWGAWWPAARCTTHRKRAWPGRRACASWCSSAVRTMAHRWNGGATGCIAAWA